MTSPPFNTQSLVLIHPDLQYYTCHMSLSWWWLNEHLSFHTKLILLLSYQIHWQECWLFFSYGTMSGSWETPPQAAIALSHLTYTVCLIMGDLWKMSCKSSQVLLILQQCPALWGLGCYVEIQLNGDSWVRLSLGPKSCDYRRYEVSFFEFVCELNFLFSNYHIGTWPEGLLAVGTA